MSGKPLYVMQFYEIFKLSNLCIYEFGEEECLDLHLSISNKLFYSKFMTDFDIVNFPFLDGDVPRSTSYGVNISQLIRNLLQCLVM